MSQVATYCRNCGKALTDEERANPGTIYCATCAPAAQPASPPAAAASANLSPPAPPPLSPAGAAGISPGLAFLLGLIPGVGAIYNGQYAKGLVHVVVFGLLISIVNSDVSNGGLGPLFGLMIPTWVVYMAFEAYHTARRRLTGEVVDEFSSIVPLRHGQGFPVGPVLLMAVGVIFLLNNLEVVRIGQLFRYYWPVLLIALGAYMLYGRLAGLSRSPDASNQEARHEP